MAQEPETREARRARQKASQKNLDEKLERYKARMRAGVMEQDDWGQWGWSSK